MADLKLNPERLSLEWVSAAEGPRFVSLITSFTERIKELGPLGSSEKLDPKHLRLELEAAGLALKDRKLRMAEARLAKHRKDQGSDRQVPEDHKLMTGLRETLAEQRASYSIMLRLQKEPRSTGELAHELEISPEQVQALFQKLEKKKLVAPDRLRQA